MLSKNDNQICLKPVAPPVLKDIYVHLLKIWVYLILKCTHVVLLHVVPLPCSNIII